MTYPTLSIANEFLRLSFEDEIYIPAIKLNKLLFIANGHSLLITGKPLISEHFINYDYGPQLLSLNALKLGRNPIYKYIETYKKVVINSPYDKIIQRVWEIYRIFPYWKLSVLTQVCTDETVISNDTIFKHMKALT